MKASTIFTFHRNKINSPVQQVKKNCFGSDPVLNFILFVFCLLHFQIGITQSNTIVWADSCNTNSFYGKIISPGYSDFTRVHEYAGGDLILVGTIKDNFAQLDISRNYCNIMRISSAGNLQWSKFIGINDPTIQVDLRTYASVVASNGDIVVALTINAASLSGNYIVRINSTGTVIWQKRLLYLTDNLAVEAVTEIIETADGGFLIAGSAPAHGVLIKLNSNGSFVWHRGIISADFNSEITAITEGPSGYFIAGSGTSLTNGFTGNYIARAEKNLGNIDWIKWIYFSGSPPLFDISEYEFTGMNYKDAVVALTGNTRINYPGANKNAQIVVYMDENAGAISATRIENLEMETDPVNQFQGSLFDPFMKTGVQFSNSDSTDYYVFRLKNDNQARWAWRVTLPEAQIAKDSKDLNDSSFVVAGFNRSVNSIVSASLLKTSAAGKLESCINQPYPFIVSTQLVSVQDIPNVVVSFSNSNQISAAALDTMSGSGFSWQLQCNNTAVCRLSKIAGVKNVCKDSSNLFSVTRNGNCSGPVIFSSNAPSAIVNNSDSSATINFSTEGTFVLYARMQAACGIISDSMIVNVRKYGTPFSLGPDTNICANNTIVLKAPGDFASYYWQGGIGDSTYLVTQPGEYYVTATDACGHIFSDTIQVNAVPAFNFSIGPDRTKCNKDTLHINGPSGFSHYQWSPGYNISSVNSQSVVINPLTDTAYYIVAEKSPGCLVFDTLKIKVNNSPAIKLGSDTAICINDTLVLDAGPGFDSYLWNNNVNTRVNSISIAGTYSLTGYYNNGCRSFDTIIINDNLCLDDIYIPTAFTPNNDGLNDIFKPVSSRALKQFHFKIYNRWGQKIFETADIINGWNGNYKGVQQNEIAFVWVCVYQFEGEEEKYKKGTVLLIR